MIDLPTTDDLKIALQSLSPSPLRTLLEGRLADTIGCGLENLTHLLVVEAGDSEDDIVQAVGFSPVTSRIDCVRNQPDWDWLERHEGWWELLYTVGNSGFAYILLVEDADEARSGLPALCRKHAGRGA